MASAGRAHHLSALAFPFVSGEALESSIGTQTRGQRCPPAVLSFSVGFCSRCAARAISDGVPLNVNQS
eukprot:8531748-Lingulodinium_polyedra.AAC.1